MMDEPKVDKAAGPAGGVTQDPKTSLARERTDLALFRTSLALDRTTLAWVRTTLGMTTFGLGMIGFFRTLRERAETAVTIREHEMAIRFGEALVVLGVIATVLVAVGHVSALKKLKAGVAPEAVRWPLSVTLAMLLALLALGGLWVVGTA
jgi:putative membrane protein